MSKEQTSVQKELQANYEKIRRFSVSVMELKNALNIKVENDLLLECSCFDTTFRITATWKVGNVPLFEIDLRTQDLEISRFTIWPNRQPITGLNEMKSILFSEAIRYGLYSIQRSMLHLEL